MQRASPQEWRCPSNSTHAITMNQAEEPIALLPVPSNVQSLIGHKYNQFTVLAYAGFQKGKTCWVCQCECGSQKVIRGNNLRTGTSRNCGCVRRKKITERCTKHGMATKANRSFEYGVWAGMLTRCKNPENPLYRNWAGKGVKVCQEWQSFENFHRDMGNSPSKKHSLDRINSNGDYCPENCRWADRTTQNNNRRDNIRVSWQGRTWTITELATFVGVPRKLLAQRISNGWDLEKALRTPKQNS